MATDSRLLYADSSALVKLVIQEPETPALRTHLSGDVVLASSQLALVEVPRATAIADPSAGVRAETERLLSRCALVEVTERLLREAAALAGTDVRTLDAIHLATAQRLQPHELVVYDLRLQRAASRAGFAISHPGAD